MPPPLREWGVSIDDQEQENENEPHDAMVCVQSGDLRQRWSRVKQAFLDA
jgi:hypothetical protein